MSSSLKILFMRKNITYILLLSLLAFAINSCKPTADKESKNEERRVRQSQTPNAITWDTLSVKNSQPLDAKGIKASGSIEINFIIPTTFSNPEMLKRLQEELNTTVLGDDAVYRELSAGEAAQKCADDYIKDYQKEAKSQLALWKKTKSNGANTYFSYNKKISTVVSFDQANFVSYRVIVEEQKGDLGTTKMLKNIVFDLSSGQIITQDDIFRDSTLDKVNELLIARIMKNENVEKVEDLQFLGYWGISDIAANNNFLVNKDGLTYTFNPGEYAEQELSLINVFIDYDDILEIIKKDSPIEALAND